jgi:hypothetical protein
VKYEEREERCEEDVRGVAMYRCIDDDVVYPLST